MSTTVEVPGEGQIRIDSCYDYEESTVIGDNRHLVGRYSGGTIDILPLEEDTSNSEYDYVAGEPLVITEANVAELVEFLSA